jgi:hypothetical protein
MTNNFLPLSFIAVFGSGIRDPGSGINIPDPQHWTKVKKNSQDPDLEELLRTQIL